MTETNMRYPARVSLAVFATLALMGIYWGCDRLSGDPDANQLPEVHFINVPLDSSVFSFAPVVHWTGHDPDGMVVAYQYNDDSTQAAVDAYDGGDEALRAYIATLPDSAWLTTYQTSDTIYLRRGEDDSITQHVFMVRCVDDLGGLSPVKVRTFFRTNNAPNAPRVKWMLDATLLDSVRDYQIEYVVPDTIFWADTVTLTYPGIGFFWQGTDPDSRELNIIPLTFSWALVCDREGGGVDTLPHPVYDDSARVTGFALGWSPWSSNTQVTIAGWFADSAWCLANLGYYFELDGNYRFLVRARDDGLTESDTVAFARFTAVRPLFDRQLLIVDWTRNATTFDIAGARPKSQIRAYYDQVLPEAFDLAELHRQFFYAPIMPEAIPFDTAWFDDADLTVANRTPYEHIRHFKWIWVIHDNATRQPMSDAITVMYPRLKVFMDYMDVGGHLMMSGRLIFDGCFQLNRPGALNPSPRNVADNFFRDYCGLSTIYPAGRGTALTSVGDFAGVSTNDQFLDSLVVDTSVVRQLRFGSRRFTYLPEIDYFGRSSGRSGYDYSYTNYNYQSSTALAEYDTTDVDLEVMSSTPSQATLRPLYDSKPILRVDRVYNVTRQVPGEVIRWYQPNANQWRILVSTPAGAGAWLDDDVLEVDYTFIPIEVTHEQPVSTNFNRIEGVITVDFNTGSYTFVGHTRFRAALHTFPLSFIKNDYTMPAFPLPGEYTPLAKFLSIQILFFNFPPVIDFGNGQGSALR